MTERYFDDFQVGDHFVTAGATITESQILDFALKYDPQPFHLDKEAAEASSFGGLIASGFQTMAIGCRLFFDARVIHACSMGSPGFDEVRWLRPVRPGDTLHTEARVKNKRASDSKPDRGVLRMDFAVKNQRGEDVLTFTSIHILARRAEE